MNNFTAFLQDINCKSFLFVVAFLSAISHYTEAQHTDFINQQVSAGWNDAEDIAFDSIGRMFIAEKGGTVWMVDTNGTKTSNPLIDISEEVGNWRDHGLNGFAVDPDFIHNGYLYLFYTVDRHYLLYYGTPSYSADSNLYFKATISRVTRFQADSTTGFTTLVPGSRTVLVGETKKTGIPVLFESHSGGDLVFGTDGSLFVLTGDGGSYGFIDTGYGNTYWLQAIADSIIRPEENVGALRSQMINNLNGKALRIDPANGDGLETNPFYDNSDPRAPRSRVWALGFRNPFRGTVRPGSGEKDITAGAPGVLYVGDVGWDNYEELNIVTAARQNCGWPLFEGLDPHSGYQNTNQVNYDAPNPNVDTTLCSEGFFRFKDLLIQDTESQNPQFVNHCDTTSLVPDSLRFIHHRPEFDYSHSGGSRTGIFINDSAAVISLTDSLSPVTGDNFGGYASVGGLWYNDTRFPYEWQNTYFHADFVGGWIKNVVLDNANEASEVKQFWDTCGYVASMALNPRNGCIAYISFPYKVRQICYTGVINNPPTAVAASDTMSGFAPLTVQFNGAASYDPEGDSLSFFWEFGDGVTSTLMNPQHLYISVDTLVHSLYVKLTVTDTAGQSSIDSILISLNNTPPVVDITSLTDMQLYSMNDLSVLPLVAAVTDAEHTPGQLHYSWKTFLHHNSHTHVEASDTNKSTVTVISPVGCDSVSDYHFRVVLTVTDDGGLSTVDSVRLYPACDPPYPAFTVSKTDVCKYDSVSFTNLTTNFPLDYEWFFPGGTPATSTSPNPIVYYNDVGLYDVKLVAFSSRGSDTLLLQDYIRVMSLPTVEVTTPSNSHIVCAASTLELTASSTSPIQTYQWKKYNIDIPGATGPTYEVTKTGNYAVVVTKANGCSKQSVKYRVDKKFLPASHITASGSLNSCIGDTVVLTALNFAGYTFQWKKYTSDLPGETASTYQSTATGAYKVITTDSVGCAKGSNKLFLTFLQCIADAPSPVRTSGIKSLHTEIYPVPAHDQLTVKFDAPDEEIVQMLILNELGAVSGDVNLIKIPAGFSEAVINISNLAPGIYTLRFQTGNGAFYRKLVKQ